MLLWRHEQRISKATLLFDSAIISTIITFISLIMLIIMSGLQFSSSEELSVQSFSYTGSSHTHASHKPIIFAGNRSKKARRSGTVHTNGHKKSVSIAAQKIAPTKHIAKKTVARTAKKVTPLKKQSHKDIKIAAKKEKLKKIKAKKKEKKEIKNNKKQQANKKKLLKDLKKTVPVVMPNAAIEKTEKQYTQEDLIQESVVEKPTIKTKKEQTAPIITQAEKSPKDTAITIATDTKKSSQQTGNTTTDTKEGYQQTSNTEAINTSVSDNDVHDEEFSIDTGNNNPICCDEQTAMVCAEVAGGWHPPSIATPGTKKVRIMAFFDSTGRIKDVQFVEKTGIIVYDYAARGALLKAFDGQYPSIMASRRCIFTF